MVANSRKTIFFLCDIAKNNILFVILNKLKYKVSNNSFWNYSQNFRNFKNLKCLWHFVLIKRIISFMKMGGGGLFLPPLPSKLILPDRVKNNKLLSDHLQHSWIHLVNMHSTLFILYSRTIVLLKPGRDIICS